MGHLKKIPIRTCIGCNETKPKKELIRVVKSPEGEVSIDFTGRANGRGAYICNNVSCLEKAVKTKRLSKAFSMQIDMQIYEELRKTIEEQSSEE
ncbi:MAG: YlxR family protein [Clostridia bacterium]|nr:YlxR family protein [Clostridia bacterium]